MKIALFILIIAVGGYASGLALEAVALGPDSKIQRLVNTGSLDSNWIPFLISGDMNKIYNLIESATLQRLQLPQFIQFGELMAEEIAPIDHANVAIDISIRDALDGGRPVLQNVVDKCIFHSPEDFDPLCVICKLLDGNGNVVGKGLISDATMSYEGSTSLEIPITSEPVPTNPTDLLANDVQDVMGVRLTLCKFNEGCTPGFWKTHSEFGPANFNAWPTTNNPLTNNPYLTGDKYLDIFGLDLGGFVFKVDGGTADPTLLQALDTQGGGLNAFARHSTAALLSASSGIVAYALSVEEVLLFVSLVDFNDNIAIEDAKDFLELQNEMDCPIGSNSPGVLQNESAQEEPEEEEEGGGKGDGKGGGKKDK